MAYRKRVRTKKQFTLPLAVVAGFVPAITGVWQRRQSATEITDYLRSSFTGIQADGSFNFGSLRTGLMPIVAGFLVHMVAGRIGINRAIARAGIPFIRI